jgi:hypothetical protein
MSESQSEETFTISHKDMTPEQVNELVQLLNGQGCTVVQQDFVTHQLILQGPAEAGRNVADSFMSANPGTTLKLWIWGG